MLSATIDNLVKNLKPRQQDILTNRFGFSDGKKKTLANIGEKYNLTRERVRQIEKGAIKTIQNHIDEKEKSIKEIKELIACHLEALGGLRQDRLLLLELKHILKDKDLHHWHLRFLSEITNQPLYHSGNEDLHNFWYLNKKAVQLANRFTSQLEKSVLGKKEEIIVHGRFHDYFIKIINTHRLPDLVGLNYLSVSRKFGISPFGDFGLNHWEEIAPKTIRSKTYLILKKHAEPLHFKDIAKAINKIKIDKRPAMPQTVHNELIKDKRFVMVGRGIYGLTERGFKPGATQEVIYRILKEKGPLYLKDAVSETLKQRLLKENTIVLNIQNKKYFKKLADGRYTLKI